MNPIKKMIIEETVSVLKEVKKEKTIKRLSNDLYEAVKTAKIVKDNPQKYKVAKKLVSIAENKLLREMNKLNENHKFEDESEMAKAQLLAIIEKAKELYRMIQTESQLEDWVQYKLSIAENYMDAIHGYMKYFNGGNEMEMETDNDMDNEIEDEMEWDDVEEEDFDEEFDDEEYYDVDDFDDEEYYDEEDLDDEFDDEEYV